MEEKVLAGIEAARKLKRGPISLRLAEAVSLGGQLCGELKALLGTERVELAGAVRRRDELVTRLDLVLVDQDEERVFEARGSALVGDLPAARAARARLAEGVTLALHIVPTERAGTELVFATGTPEHVEALVQRASTRGFLLRHDGLYGGEQRLSQSATEAGVYAALDLPLIPAELRGPWQPQAALLARESFADLLSEPDVRGAVHCHTTYSDGRNSIEEMARAAEALGLEYITITDHSPTRELRPAA